KALQKCGVEAVEVRKPSELDEVDGLIIPGGESTTLLKLMDAWDFAPALEKFHGRGRPIFGTCAGLIILAREVESPRQVPLGLIVAPGGRGASGGRRARWGAAGGAKLEETRTAREMVFIRAPRTRGVGRGVRVRAAHAGEPVMAREGRVVVATFHPELTD